MGRSTHPQDHQTHRLSPTILPTYHPIHQNPSVRIIAQEDREVWLRAVIVGLFGRRCDYTTDFIKVRRCLVCTRFRRVVCVPVCTGTFVHAHPSHPGHIIDPPLPPSFQNQCLSNDGDVRLYICSTRQVVVDGQIAVVNKLEPCPLSRHVSSRPKHQTIAHAFKQRGAATAAAVAGAGAGAGGGGEGPGGGGGQTDEATSIVLARAPQIGTLPPGKGASRVRCVALCSGVLCWGR